jgi:hypothetical protein
MTTLGHTLSKGKLNGVPPCSSVAKTDKPRIKNLFATLVATTVNITSIGHGLSAVGLTKMEHMTTADRIATESSTFFTGVMNLKLQHALVKGIARV